MPYVYTALASFIAGAAVSALYYVGLKELAESELQKAKDEVARLKGQLRAKL